MKRLVPFLLFFALASNAQIPQRFGTLPFDLNTLARLAVSTDVVLPKSIGGKFCYSMSLLARK